MPSKTRRQAPLNGNVVQGELILYVHTRHYLQRVTEEDDDYDAAGRQQSQPLLDMLMSIMTAMPCLYAVVMM